VIAMSSFATVVDTKALLETVVASLIAGVGITVIFSMAIAGAALFADARRNARPVLATGAVVLMTVGLAGSAAAIAFGIIVMTSK
jgi:hypothetical protein